MSFQSPAVDYKVDRISLDNRFIQRPASTYIMLAEEAVWRAGIMKDAMLVVDSAAHPVDGSIVVCRFIDDIRLKRLRLYPSRCLEDLNFPERRQPVQSKTTILGVITYIINDGGQVSLMTVR